MEFIGTISVAPCGVHASLVSLCAHAARLIRVNVVSASTMTSPPPLVARSRCLTCDSDQFVHMCVERRLVVRGRRVGGVASLVLGVDDLLQSTLVGHGVGDA